MEVCGAVKHGFVVQVTLPAHCAAATSKCEPLLGCQSLSFDTSVGYGGAAQVQPTFQTSSTVQPRFPWPCCKVVFGPGFKLRGFRYLTQLILLVVMFSQRLGEALHPGPEEDQEGSFLLGTMNPTGLNGKAAMCATLPHGVIGVAETHLSAGGVSNFRLGLRLANAPHKFLPGAPVPLRAHSASSVEYSGVGFLSTYPQRALPNCWHTDF